MSSSKDLISVLALVIVFSQNLIVSFMSSNERFRIFSYQLVRNVSSWFPIEGSISILKLAGMSLSLTHAIKYS